MRHSSSVEVKTTWGTWLSPSIVWVLGIELMSSDLAACVFTGSDICCFCQPSIPVSPCRNNVLFVLGKPMSAFPYHVTRRYFPLSMVLKWDGPNWAQKLPPRPQCLVWVVGTRPMWDNQLLLLLGIC